MRYFCVVVCILLASSSIANADYIRLRPNTLPAGTLSRIQALSFRNLDPAAANLDAASAVRRAIDVQAKQREIADSLLGKGFDLWGNETFEKCVEPKAVVHQPYVLGAPNKNNIYRFRQIETLADHHSNRSAGASVSIAYELFSFGASTQEDSGQTFKMNNRYIDMYMVYVGDEYAMNDGSTTKPASDALSDGKEEGFSKICGQRFISRVGFGVSLDARLTAQIQISASTKNNQSSVDVGYGKILGFTGDIKKAVEDISQKSQLAVHIAGAGGPMPKPEELLEYGRTFGSPASIAQSVQDIYIETTPYSEVGEKQFRKFDDLVKRAAGTIIGFQYDRMQTVQQLTDLETLQANAGFMEVTAGTDIPKAIGEHRTFLNKLGELYAVCRKAFDEAGIKKCTEEGAKVGPRPPRLNIQFSNQAPPPA